MPESRPIRFINTFPPVVSVLADIADVMSEEGLDARFLVSKGVYRKTGTFPLPADRVDTIPTPRMIVAHKRFCALWFALVAPLWLMFHRNRLVVFLTQPPLMFILGAWICRLKRTPYVIHVMDVYPDLLCATGTLYQGSIWHRLIHWLAVSAYTRAQAVVVIGRCMGKRLFAQGVPAERMRLVTNWAPLSLAPVPPDSNDFLQSHPRLEGKKVVLYSGNMGHSHTFQTILAVVAQLEQSRPDVLFVFCGEGVRRREVADALAQGAENLLLLDYQRADQLAHLLSASSVQFISLRDQFKGLVVPSKFYSALACGIPIVFEGPAESEVALTIRELNCGLVVSVGDVVALKDAILKIIDDDEHRLQLGANGRSGYLERLSGSVSSRTYTKHLLAALAAAER